MENGRILNLNKLPKNKLRKIYVAGLMASYHHVIDNKIYPSWSRTPSTKSFTEVLDGALENKRAHWTIIYRDMGSITGGIEKVYWDFGVCYENKEGNDDFIWISVNPIEAMKIINLFKLTIDRF